MSADREEVALAEFVAERHLSREARRGIDRLVKDLRARPVGPPPRTDAGECPDGHHDWYWLQSGPAVDGWCDRPSVFMCGNCAKSIDARCGAASVRRCGPCGRRHKHRVRKVFNSGLIRDHGEHVYWLTLTAPGDDRHWNPSADDWCDCTPEGGADPAEFNTKLPRAWSDFVTYVRRTLGAMEYAKSIEVQGRRSARTGRAFLHIHALVRTTAELASRLEDIRGLAIDLRFGHSLELVNAEPRHAAYAAKYASGSVDERHQVEWLTNGERQLGAPRMRTWTCSRQWGSTMSDIKQAEVAYATTGNEGGQDAEDGRRPTRRPARPRSVRVEEVLSSLESLRQSSTGPTAQLAVQGTLEFAR